METKAEAKQLIRLIDPPLGATIKRCAIINAIEYLDFTGEEYMNENSTTIEAVINGIELGTDGKPWIRVSLPPEPAEPSNQLVSYNTSPRADIIFPAYLLPGVSVGAKVRVKVELE